MPPPSRVSLIVADGRPTHVVLPLQDYQRLVAKSTDGGLRLSDEETREIESILNNPETEWIPARAAMLQLASHSLAEARRTAGLTQKQLADRLGVPQSQISRIEKNPDRTTVRTMRRIAQALGIEIGSLVRFATSNR